jgi:hypothetical protein
MRSLSATEAGIDVLSAAGIPDEFKLVVESDNLARTCRIVSRQERHLDVAFV